MVQVIGKINYYKGCETMQEYLVLCYEQQNGGTYQITEHFFCQADTPDHALDQAYDAYPDLDSFVPYTEA